MKSGRAKIGISQKMRIKNLRGVNEVRLKKKLDTLETSKNHLIRIFLRNGRLRVKQFDSYLREFCKFLVFARFPSRSMNRLYRFHDFDKLHHLPRGLVNKLNCTGMFEGIILKNVLKFDFTISYIEHLKSMKLM